MYALLFNSSFVTLFFMNIAFLLKRHKLAYCTLLVSNVIIAFLLASRWLVSGYFPSSNLYESLLFLTWCLTLLQVCFPFFNGNTMKRYTLINQITSPMPLLLHAFSSLNIPTQMGKIQPLVPALKSNWLIMHVSVMILSYAALLIGSMLAIVYCTFTLVNSFTQSPFYKTLMHTTGMTPLYSLNRDYDTYGKHDDWQILDTLSYQFISIGFPLLTLGIVSGSVWANEAWGSFWNWDIKETWSLITWLLYAFYIHSRLQLQWQGKPSALVASIGLFVVLICYLGVNLMATGMHSYGWLTL